MVVFTGCGKKPEPVVSHKQVEQKHSIERGNTPGNITSGGLAAAYGNWIYYRNKGVLYKMKKDGTGTVKISDDECQNINLIGGWIYYNRITTNDKKEFVEDGLWRMKIDGTSKAKLGDITNINIIGDKIYGIRERKEEKSIIGGESKHYPLSLCIMTIDGKQKIEKKDFFNSSLCGVDNMVVIDNWIYFTGSYEQTIVSELYKKKIDGTGEVLLADDVREEGDFFIEGDWIYYNDYTSDDYCYKIKTDGNEKIKLQNVKSILNAADGWIYYGDSNALYKVKIDGTELTRLLLKRDMILNKNENMFNQNFSDKLNITKNWVFYYNDYYSLIKINLSNIANGNSKTIGDFAKDICPKGMRLLETLEADVNGDNVNEYLLGFGEKEEEFRKVSFVVKNTSANTYSECGNLAIYNHQPFIVGNFSFINLDNSNKKQILIYHSYCYDDSPASPVSIVYEIANTNKKFPEPIEIYTIQREANGYSSREISDIDKDGVFELTEYEENTKNSGLMHYKKWDGKKFVKYKTEVVYSNPNE